MRSADGRVVAIAGHVHEARQEAAEGIPPDEEPHPLAFLQPQDAHGGVEELVLGDREELVAGVRLEDLGQRLPAWPDGGNPARASTSSALRRRSGTSKTLELYATDV